MFVGHNDYSTSVGTAVLNTVLTHEAVVAWTYLLVSTRLAIRVASSQAIHYPSTAHCQSIQKCSSICYSDPFRTYLIGVGFVCFHNFSAPLSSFWDEQDAWLCEHVLRGKWKEWSGRPSPHRKFQNSTLCNSVCAILGHLRDDVISSCVAVGVWRGSNRPAFLIGRISLRVFNEHCESHQGWWL